VIASSYDGTAHGATRVPREKSPQIPLAEVRSEQNVSNPVFIQPKSFPAGKKEPFWSKTAS
jgi:hypothetical protein